MNTKTRLDLTQYGIKTPIDTVRVSIYTNFKKYFNHQYSIDELLLHPDKAMEFCEYINRIRPGKTHLPHDVILRLLIQYRKNKAGRGT